MTGANRNQKRGTKRTAVWRELGLCLGTQGVSSLGLVLRVKLTDSPTALLVSMGSRLWPHGWRQWDRYCVMVSV